MGYSPDIGTASVFSTLTLNAIIGTVCLLLFELLRNNREIYAPRTRTKPDRCPPVAQGFAAWYVPHAHSYTQALHTSTHYSLSLYS
jgi:hypothetical protein